MGRHSTAITPEAPKLSAEVETLTPPASPPSKKRKRDAELATEIEVDINAPEPPSKKALRKAKKSGNSAQLVASPRSNKETSTAKETGQDVVGPEKPSNRSDHGIWIGNLSWMTTKTELRNFLEQNMADGGASITRIHLPPPSQTSFMNSRQKIKPVNKGFAYVDFATQEALADALRLSEKLFSGRKVLIKDAKSFEGRPEKHTDTSQEMELLVGKPPGKRVFVGNLGYETTTEEIREHFSPCGEIDDVFLATFEDSGKCKGYGWITFAEKEAARAAVRGWVEFVSKPDEGAEEEEEDDDDDDEEEEEEEEEEEDSLQSSNKFDDSKESLGNRMKSRKIIKPRKWWVNRFQGRPLRMEFAEGKEVRYKKRYGKGGTAAQKEAGESKDGEMAKGNESGQVTDKPGRKPELEGKKVDARTIKPGAALAAAPRLTGGIVESKGKKTIFD